MNQSQLQISVIIPAFNAEKTLGNCLASVCRQTVPIAEIIVVDNNSTDLTKQIIETFLLRDDRIKYVFEHYRSRGAARNAGIRASTGDIIAMTDSDCVVPDNWLECLTTPIIEQNESAVMGHEFDIIKNFWSKKTQEATLRYKLNTLNGPYIGHLDTKNFAIRADFLKKNLFDPQMVHTDDFDLFLRIKSSLRIRYLPNLEVGHHHKSTFWGIVKTSFCRAYWTTIILKKHRHQQVGTEPMFESFSLKSFLMFPFRITVKICRGPLGIGFYDLVNETAWRCGILWCLMKNGV